MKHRAEAFLRDARNSCGTMPVVSVTVEIENGDRSIEELAIALAIAIPDAICSRMSGRLRIHHQRDFEVTEVHDG